MLIKCLLYLTIILSGLTGVLVGLNYGYDVGRKTGQNECLIREITKGTVKCHYVKEECNKTYCPIRNK